jgi:hypothetical protein
MNNNHGRNYGKNMEEMEETHGKKPGFYQVGFNRMVVTCQPCNEPHEPKINTMQWHSIRVYFM